MKKYLVSFLALVLITPFVAQAQSSSSIQLQLGQLATQLQRLIEARQGRVLGVSTGPTSVLPSQDDFSTNNRDIVPLKSTRTAPSVLSSAASTDPNFVLKNNPQNIALLVIDFTGNNITLSNFSTKYLPGLQKQVNDLINYYKVTSYGTYVPKVTIFYDSVKNTPLTLPNLPLTKYGYYQTNVAEDALDLCDKDLKLSCYGITGQGTSTAGYANVPDSDPTKRFDELMTVPITISMINGTSIPDFIAGGYTPLYDYGFTDPWKHSQSYAYITSTNPITIAWPSNGRLAHEFGHVLGMTHPAELDGWDTMWNGWDNTIPMGSQINWATDANKPTPYSAYNKLVKGWITPQTITKPGTYTIGLSELDPTQFYKIPLSNGRPGEFYLLEYRKGGTGLTDYGNSPYYGDNLTCGSTDDSGRLLIEDIDPTSLTNPALGNCIWGVLTKQCPVHLIGLMNATPDENNNDCNHAFGFSSSYDSSTQFVQRMNLNGNRATNLDGGLSGINISINPKLIGKTLTFTVTTSTSTPQIISVTSVVSTSTSTPTPVVPAPGIITILSPNGKSTDKPWVKGQPATITWSTTGGAHTATSAQMTIINMGVPLSGFNNINIPNSGSYTFTVPASWPVDAWYHIWLGVWQGDTAHNPTANSTHDFSVVKASSTSMLPTLNQMANILRALESLLRLNQ